MDHYTVAQVIQFLEQRDFEQFDCREKGADIVINNEEREPQVIARLCMEGADDRIPEEHIELALRILNNLDECVEKALRWLKKFKPLEHNPDLFDAPEQKAYYISGIFIGKYRYGDPAQYNGTVEGFTITFAPFYYECEFTVKFFSNIWPFAVEEWVSG